MSPVTVARAVDLSFPDSKRGLVFLPMQGPGTTPASLDFPLSSDPSQHGHLSSSAV